MSDRSNLWCFVGYPGDSLPKDYLNIINKWHLPALVSPVHDADRNADDTEKKKHVHIMIYFGKGANKSFDQVKKYSDQLNATIPIQVQSRNAMVRYFIHKDNPEKHQYDINDLISLSGFEFQEAFENYTSENEVYRFIEDIINNKCIFNLVDLVIELRKQNLVYEVQFLRKHTLYFCKYLDGIYHKIKFKS